MEKNGLGKRINAVRKDRGLTADRLSEMCNINATYLRQIEGGVKMPSLSVFIDICKALKISPDYLSTRRTGRKRNQYYPGNRSTLERYFSQQTGACICHDKSGVGV